MEILSFDNLPNATLCNTIITIGKFDGVHCGHQQLVRSVVDDARGGGLKSIVLTFHPHPAAYFEPQKVPDPIVSQDYKYRLIKTLGVDAILTLSYDSWLASLSPRSYVEKIIIEKLQAKRIWIGYDFLFGKNRSGNSQFLIDLGKQYGFQTHVLGPQRIEGIVASSTKIRSCIKAGQLKEASHLLGRYHIIGGEAIECNRKPKHVCLSTFNIQAKEGMIPASGIYSGITYVRSREIASVLCVDKNAFYNVEANLINCHDKVVNQNVKIAIIRRLRDAHKSRTTKNLRMQIEMDFKETKADIMKHSIDNEIQTIW